MPRGEGTDLKAESRGDTCRLSGARFRLTPDRCPVACDFGPGALKEVRRPKPDKRPRSPALRPRSGGGPFSHAPKIGRNGPNAERKGEEPGSRTDHTERLVIGIVRITPLES